MPPMQEGQQLTPEKADVRNARAKVTVAIVVNGAAGVSAAVGIAEIMIEAIEATGVTVAIRETAIIGMNAATVRIAAVGIAMIMIVTAVMNGIIVMTMGAEIEIDGTDEETAETVILSGRIKRGRI